MTRASDSKHLARERATMVRRKERARLAELRADVRRAKRDRATRLRKLRADVRRGKSRLAIRLREFRKEWADFVREQVKQRRAAARAAWQLNLARAMRAPAKKVAGRQAALKEYRAELAAIRRWTKKQKSKPGVRKAWERRGESDDTVRHNLPAELHPVWRKYKSRIPTKLKGKTRTEAFLEWVHENPDDVLRAQWGDDDQQKLEKELREAEGAARRARKAGASAADLDLLASL